MHPTKPAAISHDLTELGFLNTAALHSRFTRHYRKTGEALPFPDVSKGWYRMFTDYARVFAAEAPTRHKLEVHAKSEEASKEAFDAVRVHLPDACYSHFPNGKGFTVRWRQVGQTLV